MKKIMRTSKLKSKMYIWYDQMVKYVNFVSYDVSNIALRESKEGKRLYF